MNAGILCVPVRPWMQKLIQNDSQVKKSQLTCVRHCWLWRNLTAAEMVATPAGAGGKELCEGGRENPQYLNNTSEIGLSFTWPLNCKRSCMGGVKSWRTRVRVRF